MYFSQRPQSPGRPQAVYNDPSSWSRLQQHPMLSQNGPPSSQTQVVGGPQQSSYGIVQYANGSHHNGSLIPQPHQSVNSYMPNHYQSPSQLHSQSHRPTTGTPPPGMSIQQVSKHWQQQLDHADACRKASSPHSRARTAASFSAQKGPSKHIIAITDPNRPNSRMENGHINGHSTQGSVSDVSDAGKEEHPSSTVAPVSTPPPAQRPVEPRNAESAWHVLDMGGMRLKNLSASLFTFKHLTSLYLGHNNLSTLNPAISSLRHLTILDLSCNQLDSLPPELGMCMSLEHLWLFDNLLETLPPELGSLHQLKIMGVEGNPLQQSLLNIIQSSGTSSLIAYLRDSCPVPMPPPERSWKHFKAEDRKPSESGASSDTFTVLTYNILGEKFATSTLYGYTPSWALAWSYRKELIITELENYDADFLCLQEVDAQRYEEFFSQRLQARDYEGVFSPRGKARSMAESERKTVDGCATFYKPAKYRLIKQETVDFAQIAIQRDDFSKNNEMFDRLLTKDNIALVAFFEDRETGGRLIVANAHLYWNAEFRDVKLMQTGILMDELSKSADWFARLPPRPPSNSEAGNHDLKALSSASPYKTGREVPLVLCGDFNSIPGSGVYDFLSEGHVSGTHADFMTYNYGKFTNEGIRHEFGLKSAYAGIGELKITNYTPSFEGGIDYIFYTSPSLSVNAVLSEIDQEYLSKVVGFPNAHFPSDHVCVSAEFRVKTVATRASPS